MAVCLVLRDRLPLLLLPSREARLLRVVLRPTRSAMSTLASVVSLGSPGSWVWDRSWPTAGEGWWSESARCRLGGGWLFPAGFLWAARGRADSGAVSPPSSPEASLDSAWTMGFWSMVVVVVAVVLVRFRLELEDCEGESGEDMATERQEQDPAVGRQEVGSRASGGLGSIRRGGCLLAGWTWGAANCAGCCDSRSLRWSVSLGDWVLRCPARWWWHLVGTGQEGSSRQTSGPVACSVNTLLP